VFRGWFAMNAACPRCGLTFEREAGYFVGAMYISYGFTLGLMLGLYGIVSYLVPRISHWTALAVTLVLFVPFVPAVFRYSRIVWTHLSRAIGPS